MKNTRWQAWETIGLLWTLAAGNLLHFVYQWTGERTVAGLFAAVNESTWEHMKLLAVPWVLFSLVEYIALRTDGVAAAILQKPFISPPSARTAPGSCRSRCRSLCSPRPCT